MRRPTSVQVALVVVAVLAVLGLGLALAPRNGGDGPTASPSDGPSPSSGATAGPSADGTSPSPAATATADASASAGPTPSGGSGELPTEALVWTRQSTGGDVPQPRAAHTWTVDPSRGTAYLVGGRGDAGPLDDAWVYDLGADAWAVLPTPGEGPGPVAGHAAAMVDDIGVAVFGGVRPDGTASDALSAYDPELGVWRALAGTGPRPPARSASCLVAGPDGRLWLSHGLGADGAPLSDTWSFDVTTMTWRDETTAGGPAARSGHGCWWTGDGRFVVYAGRTATGTVGDVWTLADGGTAGASWTLQDLAGEPLVRSDFALERFSDEIVIAGGLDSAGAPAADVLTIHASRLEATRYVGTGAAPDGHRAPALAGDPAGERLLRFGGEADGALFDELWTLELD